ncbi:hypothetical protein BOX15_Mlig014167g4, partial [Macrostomum lignano]
AMDNSGTLTSAQDPQSQRSRVFVGNLNTAQMSRNELEQRFCRYGTVLGISVHKGFGFVQFAEEWSARAAVQGEDGQVYHGMRIDANIASEPKMRRGTSGGSMSGQPAIKRARQDLTSSTTPSVPSLNSSSSGSMMARKASNLVSLVKPSNPVPEVQPEKRPTLNDPTVKDLLVCGNCKELLPSLEKLSAHKQAGCRLRLVCRCLQTGEPVSMDCSYCGAGFASAWELLVHCRDEHDLLLFGSPSTASSAAAPPVAAAVAASTGGSGSAAASSAAALAPSVNSTTVVAAAAVSGNAAKSETNGQ